MKQFSYSAMPLYGIDAQKTWNMTLNANVPDMVTNNCSSGSSSI